MRLVVALLVAFAGLAAAPLRASEEAQITTIQCIAAMGEATESDNKQVAADAAYGHYFWIGRLDPAMNEADMVDLAARAVAEIDPDNMKPLIDRCAEEMNRISDQMNRVIDKLQSAGKAR